MSAIFPSTTKMLKKLYEAIMNESILAFSK